MDATAWGFVSDRKRKAKRAALRAYAFGAIYAIDEKGDEAGDGLIEWIAARSRADVMAMCAALTLAFWVLVAGGVL